MYGVNGMEDPLVVVIKYYLSDWNLENLLGLFGNCYVK